MSDTPNSNRLFQLTLVLIPPLLLGIGGYFGFVKDMSNHHALTDQKMGQTAHTLQKQEAEIEALKQVNSIYSTLPPRVTSLEVTTNKLSSQYDELNIDVQVMKRDLGYLTKGVDSILLKLDSMDDK